MYYKRFFILVLLILSLIWVIMPAGAKETDRISLELRDIEINDALTFLASKANLNIIPTSAVSGRISLMVEDALVSDIFDIMLRSNNLACDKQGDIYNVMTEKEYKSRYGKNFSDLRQTKVFRLRYAIPERTYRLLDTMKSDIGKILVDDDSGTVLVMDTPQKIKEMEEVLVTMEKKSIIRIFSLKYARASDMEKQLKQQLDLKKVGTIRSDERTNQVIVQTFPDRMEDIADLIKGLDHRTKEILIDAKIIQVALSDNLTSGVEWEGLFDLGKEDGLAYLGSYPFSWTGAATTDVWQSRQETYQDVGYVGSYPQSGTTTTSGIASGASSVASEQMHLGMVGNHDFDTIIKYLNTLGETKILSNPKLAVINNQEAKIHVGRREAYITTTTTQSQASTTISEDVTFVDVGIQLFVTPSINDEGFVTIEIKPEVTSVIDYLETSQNNMIPIIEVATAETIVMVKDGTTILIGGLSKEETNSDSEGMPFISKIPIIGELFKSGTSGSTRTELLVLLTPHIISGDELTTGYSRDFGYSLDKQDQGYQKMVDEPLDMQSKSYQGYSVTDGIDPVFPQIKPKKDF